MKHYNIPVFISHFGCPNSCVFCNQRKINGRETDVSCEDLKNIIEKYLKTLPTESIKEVAFFGGTFTGISMQLQEEYLKVVKPYLETKQIQGIRLSTRPDYIDLEKIKLLKKYGVTTIELGVQSLDPQVLKQSKRWYEIEKVYEAVKLIKEFGIKVGIQVMIGLPGASYESDIETARKVVEMAPQLARIYPTLVIKETEMAEMFLAGKYQALSLDEAIKRAKKIYSLFELAAINIVRVGLQPSDDLRAEGNILGGPFHPAFRELVEGELYFEFLNKIKISENRLEIEANEKNISRIVGIKGINKTKLGKEFKLKINNSLPLTKIKVNGKIYERRDILLGD
jgi:hypothetical protein